MKSSNRWQTKADPQKSTRSTIEVFEESGDQGRKTMLKSLFYVLIFLMFVSCSSKKDEDTFKSRVNTLMQSSDFIETDFVGLIDFEWDRVSFGYPPYVKLKFINSKTKEERNLDLSDDKFMINEDYVRGSPAEKSYAKGKFFTIEIDHQYKNYYLIKLREDSKTHNNVQMVR